MTSSATPAASAAVVRVFSELASNYIGFVVLRNFEELPLSWRNDIDILVRPSQLAQAHEIVLHTLSNGSSSNISVLRRTGFLGLKVPCSDRELQIDLYGALSKGWVAYADVELVLDKAVKFHELFDVPHENHQKLLLMAKELFAYGKLRARYHYLFDETSQDDMAEDAWNLFSSNITDGGVQTIINNCIDPHLGGHPLPRVSSLLRPRAFLEWVRLRGSVWGPA